MKTGEDFIASYGRQAKDACFNDIYFDVTMAEDCGPSVNKGMKFSAVKIISRTRKALFYETEQEYSLNHPTYVVDTKRGIDEKIPVKKHPLESVFADVLDQVTNGKGSERHGETEGGRGLTFSEQPIMTITRYVGNGYPLGQAMKKLSEVPALMKHKGRDAAYNEILGAIAYAAAAALYLKED